MVSSFNSLTVPQDVKARLNKYTTVASEKPIEKKAEPVRQVVVREKDDEGSTHILATYLFA